MQHSSRWRGRLYCKNLTSPLQNRNVIHMLRLGRQISGRSNAGELAEIVDKMSLIKIPAGSSQISPFDRAAAVESVQRALEEADAAKHFGRKPHLIAKQLDKAARADSDVVCDRCDCGR